MNHETNLRYIFDKHSDKLYNYRYIEEENIDKIEPKTHLKYIKKNNCYLIKSGYFKSVLNSSILELYYGSRNFYIYKDKYYLFEKINKNEQLKISLQKLLDTDFKVLKKNK